MGTPSRSPRPPAPYRINPPLRSARHHAVRSRFAIGLGLAGRALTGLVLLGFVLPRAGHAQPLQKVYWTEGTDLGTIRRADLDGSSVQNLTGNVEAIWGLALDLDAGTMYWTDAELGKIQRANLDGTGLEDLIDTGLVNPRWVALDANGGKLYWSEGLEVGKIRRANFDGTGVEDLVATGLATPRGIALDLQAGKIYWTDPGTDKIQRANLDGTGVEDLVATGLDGPWGIALDLDAAKMYWTDVGLDIICRANLDGTGVENLIDTNLEAPWAIALDLEAGHLYWTDESFGRIRRANLNGTNPEVLFPNAGEMEVRGIALFYGLAPAITSSAPLSATVGQPFRYDVKATGFPAPTFALETAPSGMTIDASSGLITWTPGGAGTVEVSVTASNGVGVAREDFTLTVNADFPTTPFYEQALTPADGIDHDEFGSSAAVNGNVALVSSFRNVYTFDRIGTRWYETGTLLDAAVGFAAWLPVALSGTTAIVGTSHDTDDNTTGGSAVVFERTGDAWSPSQKLSGGTDGGRAAFGYAVSIDGDVAAVGAPSDNGVTAQSGACYVYRRNGAAWTLEQKLAADDGQPGDEFGRAVSVHGNVLLVGVPNDDAGGTDRGSAAVYRFNGATWTFEQSLTVDAGEPIGFGNAVALSDTTALIGAAGEPTNGPGSGAAYVFDWTGAEWTEQQRLTAPDGDAGDAFGTSVSLDDGSALVGAVRAGNTQSGAAYLFRQTQGQWVTQMKLQAGDGGVLNRFGASVAVGGKVALVGAVADDVRGRAAGAAYLYHLSESVDSEPVAPGGPNGFYLAELYPNPARTQVTVTYTVPRAAPVTAGLYDLLGRTVARIPLGHVPPGRHTATVPLGSLAAGLYLFRLESDRAVATRRLVVLR